MSSALVSTSIFIGVITTFILYALTLVVIWVYKKKIIVILKKIYNQKVPYQLYNLGRNKKGIEAFSTLNSYTPDIVFYFSASSSSFLIHIKMWLPYLEKTNLKIYIMVREYQHIKPLKVITNIPICFASSLRDIETFLPESVKLAFYANNGTKNTHLIRFNQLKHIQLLHGDSEKPSSYNPVSKMYDKLYVSGQRAIDRYTDNNVCIDKNVFEIIGRPQLSELKIGKQDSELLRTVLIAPTWGGYFEDTNFSSLFQIYEIVEYFFSQEEDIRVIIRLHPSTNRNDKKVDGYLMRLEALIFEKNNGSFFSYDRDIIEDFNISNCILSDISSMPIDYLYTEKPIVHLNIKNIFSTPEKTTYAKYINAVYILDKNLSNIKSIFDDVFYKDTLEDLRKNIKYYYHGKFEKPLVDKFVEVVLNDFVQKKY
ncbi:MAG TPA: hypothetical protein EYG80_06415 [Flavobacteriaceae bacterium]|nr:hypothetical protein [Flavobacteriaceae bacterium]